MPENLSRSQLLAQLSWITYFFEVNMFFCILGCTSVGQQFSQSGFFIEVIFMCIT